MVVRGLWPLVLVAVIGMQVAHSDSIASDDTYVIDGDTIAVDGKTIRLVDYEAPELGRQAHCGLERMLAARATSRLRQIIRTSDNLDLQLFDCTCRPGTEGTRWCNYGQACGHLTVDGRSVGDILAAENLAHPLICGPFSCPKRKSWCPFEPAQ
ncbi:MAG TPA: thermonuclease family protein [Xanthobacteraceae bacterium]|nr:thermonuclease family protein [Xanthobacteraceae bacterium]